MTYNVLAVCENGEQNYPVYPALNDDIHIVTEPADGALGQALQVSKVLVRRKIGNSYRTVTETKDIAFQVWFTDSRVILYCKKFEKGGGWWGFGLGGLAVAVVANTVSMAMAASRRKGKALVGNIHYPWVSAVMFASRAGFGTEEQLRLCFVDGTDDTRPDCDITLTLARGSDANRIARSLVDRIVASRYANGEGMDAAELARFETLRTSGLASPPQKGHLSSYIIPSSWRVPDGLRSVTGDGKPRAGALSVPAAGVPISDTPANISLGVSHNPAARSAFCEDCGSAELGANFCTDCGALVALTTL